MQTLSQSNEQSDSLSHRPDSTRIRMASNSSRFPSVSASERNSIMFPTRIHPVAPNPPIRTSSLPAMFDQRIPNNTNTPFIRPSPSGRGQILISKKEAKKNSKSKSKPKSKKRDSNSNSKAEKGEEEWLDEAIIADQPFKSFPPRDQVQEARQAAVAQLVTMLLEQPIQSKKYSRTSSSWKIKYGLTKYEASQSFGTTGRRIVTAPAALGLPMRSNSSRSLSHKARSLRTKNKGKKMTRFKSFIKGFSSCTGGSDTPSEDGLDKVNKGLKRRDSNRSNTKSKSGGKKSKKSSKGSPKKMAKAIERKESGAWVDISLNSGRNHSFMGISLSSHTIEDLVSNVPIIQRISPSPTSSPETSQIILLAKGESTPTSNPIPIPTVHPCDKEIPTFTIVRQPVYNSKVIRQSNLREVQNIQSFSSSSSSDEDITIEGGLIGEDSYDQIQNQTQMIRSSTPPKHQSSNNFTSENRRGFSNQSYPSTLPETIELNNQSNEMILSPSQLDEGEFMSSKNHNKGRKSGESSSNNSDSMNNYLKYGPSIGLPNSMNLLKNNNHQEEIRRVSPREELFRQKQKQLKEIETENLSRSRNGNGNEKLLEDRSHDTLDHLPEWIEQYCSTPPKSNRQSSSPTSTPKFNLNHSSNSYKELVSKQQQHPIRSSTIGSRKERKTLVSESKNHTGDVDADNENDTSISFSAWVDLERYQQVGIAGSRSASGGHLRSISGKRVIDRDVFVEGLDARSGLDRLCEALDEAQIENSPSNDEDLISTQEAYLAPLISTSSDDTSPLENSTTSPNTVESSQALGLEQISRSDSAQAITRLLGLGGIVTLNSAEFIQRESQRDLLISESNSLDSENLFYASDELLDSDQSIVEKSEGVNENDDENSFEKSRKLNRLIKENSHLEETLENQNYNQNDARISRIGSGELQLDDFPTQLSFLNLEEDEEKEIEEDIQEIEDQIEDEEEKVQEPLSSFEPPTSPTSFEHHLTSAPCAWFLTTIDEYGEEEEEEQHEEEFGEEDESMDDTFALKGVVEIERKSSTISSQSVDPDESSVGLGFEKGQTIWKEDYNQTKIQSSISSPILSKVLKVTQSSSVRSNINLRSDHSNSPTKDVENSIGMKIDNENENENENSLIYSENSQRYELDEESEEERSFKQEIFSQSLISQNKVRTKKKSTSSSSSSCNHLLSEPSPSGNLIGLSPILESPNPNPDSSESSSKFKDLIHFDTSDEEITIKESKTQNEVNSSSRKEKPTSLWGDSDLLKGDCPRFSFSKPMENQEDLDDFNRLPNSPISPTSLLPLPLNASSNSSSINENKRGSWSSGVSYESEIDSRRTSTASGTSSQTGLSVSTSITSGSTSNQISNTDFNEKGKEREIIHEEKFEGLMRKGQSSTTIKRSGSILSFHSSFSISDDSEIDYHSSNESEISHGEIIDGFPIAPNNTSSSSSSNSNLEIHQLLESESKDDASNSKLSLISDDSVIPVPVKTIASSSDKSSSSNKSNQDQLLEELKLQLENKIKVSKTKNSNVIPVPSSTSKINTNIKHTAQLSNQFQTKSMTMENILNPIKSSDSQEVVDQLLYLNLPESCSLGTTTDGDEKRFRHKISPGIAARFQAAYTFTRPIGSGSNPNLSTAQSGSDQHLVELKQTVEEQ